MKIAHFADLHINSSVRDSNIAETIALFENAIKHGAEHFCITGDISHNAEQEDLETLRYILDYFNLLDSGKVSIVIGNHDIFGGPQKAEDVFTFPQTCKEIDYDAKVETFAGYYKELFDNCVYKSDVNNYPYAKIVDNVLLIGLNSIDRYSSVKNPFASNGLVDEEQLKELELILTEYGGAVKHKIIMIHHHFNKIKSHTANMMHYFWQVVEKQTMKLKKKTELFELFGRHNIDIVLHGHIHETMSYSRKEINFLNSGGCMNKAKIGELCFNLIEINKKGIETEVVTFPFHGKKKKYLRQFAAVHDII